MTQITMFESRRKHPIKNESTHSKWWLSPFCQHGIKIIYLFYPFCHHAWKAQRARGGNFSSKGRYNDFVKLRFIHTIANCMKFWSSWLKNVEHLTRHWKKKWVISLSHWLLLLQKLPNRINYLEQTIWNFMKSKKKHQTE